MEKQINTTSIEAQNLVNNAINEINEKIKMVLTDYINEQYLIGIAKAVSYLGLSENDFHNLFNNLEPERAKKIYNLSKNYKKTDPSVILEIEHIVNMFDIKFDKQYKIIKENLISAGKSFAKEAIDKFRIETPIFQKKIDDCIFSFEDIINLDLKTLLKFLQEADQKELAYALHGASTEVQAKIFNSMSTINSDMLKEDMEFISPVTSERVQIAQEKLVKNIIKILEENNS